MSTKKAYFQQNELSHKLPDPGYYHSDIKSAGFRNSTSGNRMLQLLHRLDGVGPAHELVADYFVLEGGSPQGLLMARRRLVQLYRACGLEPKQGDEIAPKDLVEARVQVRVAHDEWENQPRLRVVAYRAYWCTDSDVSF